MINTTITGTDTLTLQQIKKHSNITISDDDAYLTTLISVTLSAVEGYCRSLFLERENTQVISGVGSKLPPLIISDVTQDTNNDTIVLTYTSGETEHTISIPKHNLFNQNGHHYNYVLNKLYIYIMGGADIDADTDVTIVWKVGEDSSEDSIHQARLLLIGTYYENRESAVSTFQNSLPNGVEYLLEPYMKLQVG